MKSTNDARLAILSHITDFFMEFTSIEGLDAAAIKELVEEAEEQASLLMDSMTLEVTGVQDGLITLSFRLRDIGAFIDEYLDSKFVDDVTM